MGRLGNQRAIEPTSPRANFTPLMGRTPVRALALETKNELRELWRDNNRLSSEVLLQEEEINALRQAVDFLQASLTDIQRVERAILQLNDEVNDLKKSNKQKRVSH